jgi:imidazolonepropionase-like amidohydrolase
MTAGAVTGLRGITVWDGDELRGPSDVTWDGRLITEVRPSSGTVAEGLAVIPGLIDTHVHTMFGPASGAPEDPVAWRLRATDAERVLHAAAHAVRAFRGGVTTLRDMAGDASHMIVSQAFESDLLTGPRLFVCGMVGVTGGHNDSFTPSTVRPRRNVADGPYACRALVREHARSGVHGIKVATGGGVLSSGSSLDWRNYTPEEIEAIVDEAHSLGLPVAAHAHTEKSIQIALDAGVDSIEHASMVTDSQARQIASNNLTIAPTLGLIDKIVNGEVSVEPEKRRKATELAAGRERRLREAAEAGVSFVLGTDADGFFTPFDEAMNEVQRMHRILGLSPEQALRSATSRAAHAVRKGDTLGRVAEGYAADFVVLKGRPWEDINELATSNIVAVVSRGAVVVGELPAATPA